MKKTVTLVLALLMILSVSADNEWNAAPALHGFNDGDEWRKMARDISNGSEVTAIAERTVDDVTYSCCLYEQNGFICAGWIDNGNLA